MQMIMLTGVVALVGAMTWHMLAFYKLKSLYAFIALMNDQGVCVEKKE